MPDSALYGFSNFLAFLAEYIVRYRKSVIQQNLKNSFPEKSKAELKRIQHEFYRHFCDFLVESAKSLVADVEDIMSRCSFDDFSTITNRLDNGKHVFVLSGHYNNWEYYSIILGKVLNYPMIAAYQPLSNKFFNELITSNREKCGLNLLEMHEIPAYLKKQTEAHIVFLISDQRPKNLNRVAWIDFLNQKTAWPKSAETIAKSFDAFVTYGVISKPSRGRYAVQFKTISENANSTQDGEVLTDFVQKLEDTIQGKPQHWLWSHKRWKNQA